MDQNSGGHVQHSARANRWSVRFLAGVAALAMVAAACGGGGSSNNGKSGGSSGDSGGTPVEGGSITYGLDAEHPEGFCDPTAQLAAAGILENLAIYDTLTVPNDKGDMVPYLAESVTHSADYKTWTIKVRPNIKFQDGEALDANAVKTNFDAYRKGPLFGFVFQNITGERVVDPLTVAVDMKLPWIAFPSALFGTGRVGMVAPNTLANTTSCSNHPVGTGPFMFKDWVVNDHLTVVKNPTYWRKDSAGRALPYLDQITFRPIIDPVQRLNALKAGQLNLMMTDNGDTIFQARQAVNQGTLADVENQKSAEIGYTMLRVDKPPFDDLTARQAAAYAADRDELNQISNHGLNTLTDTPFAPDVFGYVKEPVQPPIKFDLDKAKQLVSQYKAAHGGKFEFTLLSTNDPTTVKLAQLVQSQWDKAGMTVHVRTMDQGTLINTALGGNFEATLWRNHPGGDPDTQYVWWHSGSPVNFGAIKDAQIDKDLDEGRSATDENTRKADYEDLQKVFGEKLYNLWSWYSLWAFISKPNVHGISGPDLPTGGKQQLVASVHPMVGLWVSK
jgi:peptide/nickel transport system substrate-binding protein